MLFLLRSAPEVEKRIHSKLFRIFLEEPGYKRAGQTYCIWKWINGDNLHLHYGQGSWSTGWWTSQQLVICSLQCSPIEHSEATVLACDKGSSICQILFDTIFYQYQYLSELSFWCRPPLTCDKTCRFEQAGWPTLDLIGSAGTKTLRNEKRGETKHTLNCKINGTVHIFFLKKSYLSPRCPKLSHFFPLV